MSEKKPQAQALNVQIETRHLEVWANRVLQVCREELKLTPIEAVFVLGEVKTWIEKTEGVQIHQAQLTPGETPPAPAAALRSLN